MIQLIKKLLLKFLEKDLYRPEKVELEKMRNWLYNSYKEQGFHNYYTMRKRYLMNQLALGIEGKEQAETLGRWKELKALSVNIKDENDRRIAKEAKEKLEAEQAKLK